MLGTKIRIISASVESAAETRSDVSPESASGLWNRVLPFALIFLAACVIFFSDLGKYPLFNPDEALYAEPAREMLEIGDYITTYLNYVVRFTKPPLTIWAQAVSILAFGCNEFAVRFFGAACGALLVATTYCISEKIAGRRAAIVSSLSLITAPLFVGTGREAITDMPLSFYSAGAMFCFFLFSQTKNKPALWLAYICCGLAVMTKGPVGVVLPVSILFVYHFLKQNLLDALKFYKPLQGLLIVGLISLPWFVTEIVITGGGYFNDFIMKENFQRFTSVVDSHRGAYWYHLAAMMGGFFPWSVFIPQAVYGAFQPQRLARERRESGLFSCLNAYRGLNRVEDFGLYCACWTAVTLLFYSASVSKLLPYTLPAFPAVAVLIALEFERILAGNLVRRATGPVLLLSVIFAVASSSLSSAVGLLRDAPVTLSDLLQSLCSYELIFSVAAVTMLGRGFLRSGFFLFIIPTFVGFLFFGNRLLTVLSNNWEQPLPAMARFAAVSLLPILVYDMRKPSVPFYAGRQVIQPASDEELRETLRKSAPQGAYILSKARNSEYFRQLPGCKIVFAEGRFILVHYSASGHCKGA